MSATEPIVRFVGIGKTYDGVTRVVEELHLDIERGEFLTLLGPSGSGKTTTMMLLAGFETPTAGEILLEGKPLSRVPPYQRNMGMVFQNYALFPHMSIAENIGFPLSVRGVPPADLAKRVERALDMVQLGGFGPRRPAQLSGGQQQRVAVARALVFEPKLILMDEPLGALDKQLREQMQLEIRRLHQRLGVTMVYVTHDQAEALTMSDRIAVFHRGKIQQLDAPEQMYEYPKNAFVARFIGENNRLEGRLEAVTDGRCTIRIAVGDTPIDGTLVEPVPNGGAVTVSLRPERVQIRVAGHTIDGHAGCRLAGSLREIIYLGDHVRARVALTGNEEFMVKRPISEAHTLPHIGAAVEVFWAPEHCRAFAQES
jgi:putative spermidine/putrescine transport system ATP-binding protein